MINSSWCLTLCDLWNFSVYILYRDNGPGMVCQRHCFSCTGFFDCSSRELRFAIQTLKTGKDIISNTVKRPLFLCLLKLRLKQIFLKEKMWPKMFSRPFSNFIHNNLGSGGKNCFLYSHCNQNNSGIMSGDGSYCEVSNKISYYKCWCFLLKQRLSVIMEGFW